MAMTDPILPESATRVRMRSQGEVLRALMSNPTTALGMIIIVALLGMAIFAPYLKTIGLALVQFRLLDARTLPWLSYLGKLAMADIFLIALYVVVVKGVSRTHVEGAWGLYLFTACVLASIAISIAMARQGGLSDPRRAAGAPPPEDIRHPKTQGH